MMENALACASYGTIGNTTRVLIPIKRKLSVSSVISSLGLFKNWKLLNVCVVFTEDGCDVVFIFQNQ